MVRFWGASQTALIVRALGTPFSRQFVHALGAQEAGRLVRDALGARLSASLLRSLGGAWTNELVSALGDRCVAAIVESVGCETVGGILALLLTGGG